MKTLAYVLMALIVLVIVAVAILFFGGFFKAPEIRSVRLSWGDVTADSTTVNADIVVENPGRLGVRVAGIRIKVPVDFYDVRVLSLERSGVRLPRGESTLHLSGKFRQADLPRWWPEFVRNREHLAIHVRPRVEAPILGRVLGVGFGAVETDAFIPLLDQMKSTGPATVGFDGAEIAEIARDPARHLIVGPPQPARPIVTVESWELHWGDAGQAESRIAGTVIVRNQAGVPLPVEGLRVAIDLNGRAFLPDTRVTPEARLIAPGQSTTMQIQGSLENARLVSWWTSHLQNKETTTGAVRLGLVILIPADIAPGLAGGVELPLMAVPGFQCRIQTDIMAAANYEIARALGRPAGPAPAPVAADCGKRTSS